LLGSERVQGRQWTVLRDCLLRNVVGATSRERRVVLLALGATPSRYLRAAESDKPECEGQMSHASSRDRLSALQAPRSAVGSQPKTASNSPLGLSRCAGRSRRVWPKHGEMRPTEIGTPSTVFSCASRPTPFSFLTAEAGFCEPKAHTVRACVPSRRRRASRANVLRVASSRPD
jgi:hypothetical protein